ncbi:MAG: efflux RND transporter permease subunit [Gemmatimonadetes bacterium]|nr:efflux RND transporter permease subunit [Gemmatimonadota bacterium]
MLNAVIYWSLRHRFLVIAMAVGLAVTGAFSLAQLPIDAFPDTTPVQVQVNTVAPALSPVEIEQQITFPVEQAISGLRGLVEVRSLSKFGFSQVTVIFDDDTDIYLARQQVMERLSTVELPEGLSQPKMGPVATGLGEVFHYILTSDTKNLSDLRSIQDWIIRPQLRSVSGVAEVNSWGGHERHYQVVVDPAKLAKYDLSLLDLFNALRRNNANVGGGNITRSGEQLLVQGIGFVTTLEEIGNIVVTATDGVPIYVRDLGDVIDGHEVRRGAVTYGGKGEAVLGLGFMLMGENSRDVTERLKTRMEQVRMSLPPDVEVKTVYDRTELVDLVLGTVRTNLFEGAILVVVVLFLFLGNFRAGLIVALAIPLSMLFAGNLMLRVGIAGSLMSLGAIDFGLIVDSSVIMIENSVRHLAESKDGRSRIEIVRDAAGRPTGVFKDNAIDLIARAVPATSDELDDRALDAAMAYVAEQGVTSVHHMGTLGDLQLFRRAHARGGVGTRIMACTPLALWEALAQLVESEGRGDEWVRWGCLKGFVDGSLGSHTAAFFEPFTDAPDDTGLFVNSEEDLHAWTTAGDAAGLQVNIHAIGDRAIATLLDIFERVETAAGPRDRRFRIEHAQHLRPSDFQRFARLGVIASMQPYHAIDDGRWAEKVIGPERIKTTYGFRAMLDNGVTLAFGSDWFVAPPTPLEGLYAAVTRRTLDDAHPGGWVPDQKITLDEALRAYTVGGAYASYEEDLKGTLELGKLADVVVIDRDLFDIAPEEIRDARVWATIVGGRIVFEGPR